MGILANTDPDFVLFTKLVPVWSDAVRVEFDQLVLLGSLPDYAPTQHRLWLWRTAPELFCCLVFNLQRNAPRLSLLVLFALQKTFTRIFIRVIFRLLLSSEFND